MGEWGMGELAGRPGFNILNHVLKVHVLAPPELRATSVKRNLSRRRFLRLSAGGSAAAAGLWGGLPPFRVDDFWSPSSGGWNALRRPVEASPRGLTLTAAPGIADIGG